MSAFKSAALFAGCGILLAIYFRQNSLAPVTETLLEEYDYVIVGAGASGAVIAARLLEDDDVTVAVLEAGGEETEVPQQHVPINAPSIQTTEYDWRFFSVPQKHSCQGLKNKQSVLISGKILGGGSMLNYMVYTRSAASDYDQWAELGAEGWSYKDVLPYFIKAENNQNPELAQSPYHGTSGPLGVSDSRGAPELKDVVLEAAKELGNNITDVNGESATGWSTVQMTAKNGVRMSTARAYLRPAMSRDNLHVTTRAYATKVLMEGSRAVGVEYEQHGVTRQVRARREVIVSAGGIGSPRLLLLSGIGPKQHLDDLQIPVVADLPVGENYQNHIYVTELVFTINATGGPYSTTGDKANSWWSHIQYQLFGTGPRSSMLCDAGGFARSKHQPDSDKSPYLQFLVFATIHGGNAHARDGYAYVANIKKEDMFAIHGGLEGRDGFTIIPVIGRLKSRGTVRLASADPGEPPLIDPNFLEDQIDVDIILDGIRQAQALAKTKAMEKLGVEQELRQLPACSAHALDSDAYWQCHIRHLTQTVFHPSGTCKMGRIDDITAVVDPELRVRGLSGLRVVDSSIQPLLVVANTYAPCVMIGEKAADMVKAARKGHSTA